ncbi:MAG TPA: shikimate dehydrogenase [Candidatus Binatia bacterium]|jgi:shikimate dehydrogenase
MAPPDDIARIQSCIRNRLDRKIIGTKPIAAVIGAAPSRYSKSPALWNATFQALKMSAVYVPLDVDGDRLPDLIAAVKESDRVLGLNVTVPHKVAVMNYLDAVDEAAARIGAVNTIVRGEKTGRLAGANTDGAGFVESLLTVQSGCPAPLVESLKGLSALILGAGGSARAVAFALAERLESGRLIIANRTRESAASLASEIGKSFANVAAINEEQIPEHARHVDIIINCTTKGQSGFLERYSALAPAHPANGAGSPGEAPAAIEANNAASLNLALSIPPTVGFYDLIYHPAETIFLRHGRLSGHRTLNGRGMIVAQAVESFYNYICRRQLEKAGLHTAATRRRIAEIMNAAW